LSGLSGQSKGVDESCGRERCVHDVGFRGL
jgi:hypothetical protein